MKIQVTYRRNLPTTVNGDSIKITYLYTGSKEEIDEIEQMCKNRVGSAVVIDTENMSSRDLYKL